MSELGYSGEWTAREALFAVVAMFVAMGIGMLVLWLVPGPHHDTNCPKYREHGDHQTHSAHKDKQTCCP